MHRMAFGSDLASVCVWFLLVWAAKYIRHTLSGFNRGCFWSWEGQLEVRLCIMNQIKSNFNLKMLISS